MLCCHLKCPCIDAQVLFMPSQTSSSQSNCCAKIVCLATFWYSMSESQTGNHFSLNISFSFFSIFYWQLALRLASSHIFSLRMPFFFICWRDKMFRVYATGELFKWANFRLPMIPLCIFVWVYVSEFGITVSTCPFLLSHTHVYLRCV